jgi:hypothetical protein
VNLPRATRDADWKRATGERVARTIPTTWLSAFVGFLFEQWVGTLMALNSVERAFIWASGMTVSAVVCTVVLALCARHFGQPGTDSFLKFIGYTR